MENIVKYIVSNLIDENSQIDVNTVVDGDVDVITVTVDESQIGKVIGKNGRIAQSIRAIIRSIGAKSNKKFAIKIVSR